MFCVNINIVNRNKITYKAIFVYRKEDKNE